MDNNKYNNRAHESFFPEDLKVVDGKKGTYYFEKGAFKLTLTKDITADENNLIMSRLL
jgi:hypothetical protein